MDVLYAIVLQALIIAPALYLASRKGWRVRHMLLLLLAVPFLLCALWGVLFRVEPGQIDTRRSDPLINTLMAFWWATPALAIGVTWRLRGSRLIAAIVGVVEIPLTLVAVLLAAMQVSGSWI